MDAASQRPADYWREQVERALLAPVRAMRRAVGAAEILGGLLGTVSVLSVFWSVFVHGGPQHLRTVSVFAGLTSVLLVYAFTVVAGRELYRQRRAGVILSGAVLALQVASFRVFGFMYELALPGSVYLYFPSGQLTLRLGSNWGLGWGQAGRPAFLGINLVVLSMLGLVFGPTQPPSQGPVGSSERPV